MPDHSEDSATRCQWCGCRLDTCRPLRAHQRKCCPDCEHTGGDPMTPAEIDRMPLEELRRFAHHQQHLIKAFRRQNNYHLNCIRDLEQQIKTLKSKEESGNRVQSHDEAGLAEMAADRLDRKGADRG